jgi:hypothetical protein
MHPGNFDTFTRGRITDKVRSAALIISQMWKAVVQPLGFDNTSNI